MNRKSIFLALVISFSFFLLASSIPFAMANDQPSFDNYRVSQSVVDRDVDYSGSGVVDNTSFTVYALDNDGIIGSSYYNENAISSVTVRVEDNNGNFLTSSTNFDNAYLGDNVCLFENFVWNPSDSITNENLGQTSVRVEVEDNQGYQDNLAYTTENAPFVTDRIVENIAFENNYEHVLKVTGDSSRIVGSAPVSSTNLEDNHVGTLPIGYDNLVGYWNFQDNSNLNVWDASSNNNTGTMKNMAVDDYVAGHGGRALSFDGSDDYVEVPSNTSLNLDGNSFTLSVWGYSEGTFSDYGVFSKKGSESTDEWLQCSVKLNSIELWFYGNDLSGSYDFTAGNWYFATFRYDASTNEQSVWVNGNKINSRTAGGDLQNTDDNSLVIGAIDGTSWTDGKIDDPRVYNRALTSSEIRRIYRSGMHYPTDDSFETSYKTTQDGKVTAKVTDNVIDGISSSQLYTFPNFHPSIESVSVDRNLIDRDVDNTSFGAVDNVTITYTVSDPDNRTNDLDSGASALLSVRDNSDTNCITDNEIISSRVTVDENTVKVTKTYNPSDTLSDNNLGAFDTKLDLTDHYGMENISGFTGAGGNIVKVDDVILDSVFATMVTDTARTITVSGSAHRITENVSLDNVSVYDNSLGGYVKASFNDNSYSATYKVEGDVGKTYTVRPVLLDKGSRLDGSVAITYTVYTNYGPPIDFENDVWIKTTTENVYWDLTGLTNPVNYVGISSVDDEIRLMNDNSSAGDIYGVTLNVNPSWTQVDVRPIYVNDGVQSGTALKMKMEDSVEQAAVLTVKGLRGNQVYNLYEDGALIKGKESSVSGEWRCKISDIGSTYVLKAAGNPSGNPIIGPGPAPEPKLSVNLRTGFLEASGSMESENVVSAEFEEAVKFQRGDMVVVMVTVTTDGEPVEGAEVTGWWIPDPGTSQSVPIELGYTGDGTYQGSFTVPEVQSNGTYSLGVEAEAGGYKPGSATMQFKVVKVEEERRTTMDKIVNYLNERWVIALMIVIAFVSVIGIAEARS